MRLLLRSSNPCSHQSLACSFPSLKRTHVEEIRGLCPRIKGNLRMSASVNMIDELEMALAHKLHNIQTEILTCQA